MARLSSKDEFVEQHLVLCSLPAVPPYRPRMRRRNAEGPAPLAARVARAQPGSQLLGAMAAWVQQDLPVES